MRVNGIEIVNKVIIAQLCTRMGLFIQAVSRKIILRDRVNLNGHLDMSMKANGKNLKWRDKENLNMSMEEYILDYSEETISFKINASLIPLMMRRDKRKI